MPSLSSKTAVSFPFTFYCQADFLAKRFVVRSNRAQMMPIRGKESEHRFFYLAHL
jgi:hypothetical protein